MRGLFACICVSTWPLLLALACTKLRAHLNAESRFTLQSVKSGIFIMPFHSPGKPLAQCHDEDMELALRAEELGYDEFWVGEHHTLAWEPIVSPEMFIAAVFRQTKRMRLGPAPILLNLHHPAQVAHRLAFLDHFSHGRLNLAFGYGGSPADFSMYGQEPSEMQSRLSEAMGVILKIWTSDGPYELVGDHWTVKLESSGDEMGFGVVQKPLQRPYPPISVPVTSRGSGSVKAAALLGFHPFSHSIIPGNVLKDQWDTYESTADGAGLKPSRDDWKIARTVFLADTTKEAEERARRNAVTTAYEYVGKAIGRRGGLGVMKRDLSMPDSDVGVDYFMNELVIAGDVDTALDRLLQLWEETGPFGTLSMMEFGWIDEDDRRAWLHSTELFTGELLPRFNAAVGATVTVS